MPFKEYSKTVHSNPQVLPEIESFILSILNENKIDEEFYNAVTLSVAEASANSIVHGNKSDPSKTVEIKVKISAEKLIISFKDEGEGFDPKAVPDPTTPDNILKDSGRGIHIMKSYLNSLKYNFTPTGTEVILELKIHK